MPNGLVDLDGARRAARTSTATRPVKIASVTSCSQRHRPVHAVSRHRRAHASRRRRCASSTSPAARRTSTSTCIRRGGPTRGSTRSSSRRTNSSAAPAPAACWCSTHELYRNRIPDNPGGGTVDWTNPWGEHKYVDDVEAREDGGTPGFLQAIRAALCIAAEGGDGHAPRSLAREAGTAGRSCGRRCAPIPACTCSPPTSASGSACSPSTSTDLHYNLAVRAAERPLRHPGARRLFLRRHLWPLPAAGQPRVLAFDHLTRSTPASSATSRAGCGVAPSDHDRRRGAAHRAGGRRSRARAPRMGPRLLATASARNEFFHVREGDQNERRVAGWFAALAAAPAADA